MSDWHFGMDYDMWLYPPVDWTAPDYDYELPEPIEAANIEGTLLVNAEDAIEQVHCLQTENAKLRELVRVFYHCTTSGECDECPINGGGPVHLMPDTICDTIHDRMHELGVEE